MVIKMSCYISTIWVLLYQFKVENLLCGKSENRFHKMKKVKKTRGIFFKNDCECGE